jgi:integrase/recombinase XerD
MVFESLKAELVLRGYSWQTIKAYMHYNRKFLAFARKPPQNVKLFDIKAYILSLAQNGKSSSTVNLAHNALLFYYNQVLKRKFHYFPFQKRAQKIPDILSINEIKQLIQATKNQKHKLIIMLLYSSGMRLSELVKLKYEHINKETGLAKIRYHNPPS